MASNRLMLARFGKEETGQLQVHSEGAVGKGYLARIGNLWTCRFRPSCDCGLPSEANSWYPKQKSPSCGEKGQFRGGEVNWVLPPQNDKFVVLELRHGVPIPAKAVAAVYRTVSSGPERYGGLVAALSTLNLEHFPGTRREATPLFSASGGSAGLAPLGLVYKAPRIEELLLPYRENKLTAAVYAYQSLVRKCHRLASLGRLIILSIRSTSAETTNLKRPRRNSHGKPNFYPMATIYTHQFNNCNLKGEKSANL